MNLKLVEYETEKVAHIAVCDEAAEFDCAPFWQLTCNCKQRSYRLNKAFMVKITDFSSVVEIAFGLNALFYFYELIPHTEDRLKELMHRNDELYERKVRLTKNTEAFPIGFMVGATHPIKKWVLQKMSLVVSLTLLAVLLYSSFRPDFSVSISAIWILLAIGYGLPLISFYLHKRTLSRVAKENEYLELQIEDAQKSEDRFVLNLGGHQLLVSPPGRIISKVLSLLTTNPEIRFLRLGKKDKHRFIQVAGSRKNGFSVEYQETASDRFFKANRRMTKDETIELLELYLNDNTEWKDLADWESVEGQISPGPDHREKSVTITSYKRD